MAFIVMVVLVCMGGLGAWQLCKYEIEKCYVKQNAEELELDIRPRPTGKKLLIYMILSTVLNIGLLALSYYVYEDRVVYAFKLAMIFQWIIVIAFIDYHTFIIPNRMILGGLGMAVFFATVEILLAGYPMSLTLKDYFFGFLLGALVFLISALIVKGSVGMGDVKLFSVLGLLLGCTGVFNLLFFTILVSAVSGIYLLLRKKGNKKTLLPLAPFTYVGMVLVLLMGI